MTKIFVIADIKSAFSGVAHPGAHCFMNYAEASELDAAYQGESWPEVSEGFLESYASELYLLTPLGFRFYLPVFLIGLLRTLPSDHSTGVDWHERVLFNLRDRCGDLGITGYSVALPDEIAILDHAQRYAVRSVLLYLFDNDFEAYATTVLSALTTYFAPELL